MKIVQKLGQKGYLKTIRGKGGGFHMGRRPEDINLGELIRTLESTSQLVDCDGNHCRITFSCQLKGVLVDAMKAFMSVLDQYTLADLVNNRKDLNRLLSTD